MVSVTFCGATKLPREAFLNTDLLATPWLPSLQRLPGADRQKALSPGLAFKGSDAVLSWVQSLSLTLHLCPGRQQPGEGRPGRRLGARGTLGGEAKSWFSWA